MTKFPDIIVAMRYDHVC